MSICIPRRSLIAALASAAAWPIAAHAQRMPVIGYLSSLEPGEEADRVAAVRQGLRDMGYVEGQNIAFEYRWADGQYDRLPALAFELVRRRVAVIISTGGVPGARAAKAATTTIPIVFATGADPVAFGLVTSLARPSGNATGVTSIGDEVAPKRLELLHELVPGATVFALLVNPTNPNSEAQSSDMQRAARALGLDLHVLRASSRRDFDRVFTTAAERRVGGLVIGPDTFFGTRGPSTELAILSARHAMPAISFRPDFPAAGGLMSYGTNVTEQYRQLGNYAGRILMGENPADLPVERSTKIELVINLKTAKVLGIGVPLTLRALATKVIE